MDFKVADYGWLRRLDVSSVDWVEYHLRARKFNACCPLRFRRHSLGAKDIPWAFLEESKPVA